MKETPVYYFLGWKTPYDNYPTDIIVIEDGKKRGRRFIQELVSPPYDDGYKYVENHDYGPENSIESCEKHSKSITEQRAFELLGEFFPELFPGLTRKAK